MSTGAQLLIDSATNRVFVIGVDAQGAKGAALASGDSVAVSVDNTELATLTPDPTPLPDPAGNPSVYSGVLAPVTPIVTAIPFNVTSTATIGGVAQPTQSAGVQWKADVATATIEEVN